MDYDKALTRFRPPQAEAIDIAERRARIAALQRAMQGAGRRAVWLDASSSLSWFTGLALPLSERMHGAIIPAQGPVIYVTPTFEEPKLRTMLQIGGDILRWEEHDSPGAMIAGHVRTLNAPGEGLALDPATPFLFAETMMGQGISIHPARGLISGLRQIKSAQEIAIIQAAMDASYQVQRAVHAGLRSGISTREVSDFVDAAHRAMGMAPQFAITLFGEATAYPHGVPYPQNLQPGDMVLVDIGARLKGYHSDITRSYVFGQPSARQSAIWQAEYAAQSAAFAAAKIGAPCSAVDAAARGALEALGYGPGYALPGLPHRTGHGLGADIHEEPFIVSGNDTPLAPGMVFSIEPMLCLYGECGVRLEDICVMGETGPRWFCPPATDPAAPFPTAPVVAQAD
jgi:Xaa-Pro dipeptidase